MNKENLKYYNEFGGFREDGKEYIIDTNNKTTPCPWSHIIANENFGTLVTANGGGYIWSGNSQQNKITKWSNNALYDTPSEILTLVYKGRKIGILPYEDLKSYKVYFGFGYAKYIYEDEDIKITTLIYVPLNENKKVYKICIKKINEDLNGNLQYEMIPVLGVTRKFTKKHIVIQKEEEYVTLKNMYREIYKEEKVIIKSSREILSFDDADQKVKFNIKLSNEKNEEIQIEVSTCDTKMQNVENDLQEIYKFWNDKINIIKVNTPIESINIMMNGWLLYQTITSRLWGRTSFYQAGGAFGFRDQLQDSLILLWFDENLTKKQILYHAMHEFKEGDVLHWWHPEKNNGTRTRYSDDLLWLPYLISKYIEFTEDYTILDEELPYVEGPLLLDEENEKYIETSYSEYKDSLYSHALKVIEYGVRLSENGLPQIGSGDWNDGMNKVNGESIWLGFFIYEVLKNFIKICEYKKDEDKIKQYKEIMDKLKVSLNDKGWDGKWFRRGYYKDGSPIGSINSEECKIDGISQAWAVISGAGDKDKCVMAMGNVESYLVDRENMIIKLLTPPFDQTSNNPGYIKEYIPGVRENGGQYTHGAIWSIIAESMLNNSKKAIEYIKMVNPIEHSKTLESALKYKVEPYVVAADIYANSAMLGRGGWTWYTGSSSWLYIATLEYVLGIKKRGDKLIINPVVPHYFKEFNILYKYKNSEYNIIYENKEEKENGQMEIYLDGVLLNKNEISLKDDLAFHEILIKTVYLGRFLSDRLSF